MCHSQYISNTLKYVRLFDWKITLNSRPPFLHTYYILHTLYYDFSIRGYSDVIYNNNIYNDKITMGQRLNFGRSYGLLQMFVVKIGELLNKMKEFNLIC